MEEISIAKDWDKPRTRNIEKNITHSLAFRNQVLKGDTLKGVGRAEKEKLQSHQSSQN